MTATIVQLPPTILGKDTNDTTSRRLDGIYGSLWLSLWRDLMYRALESGSRHPYASCRYVVNMFELPVS